MEHDTPGLLAWLRALSAEDRATLPIQWERMQPVSLHDVETIMALAPPDAVELLRDRFAALIDGDATTRAWVKSLPPGEARDAAWEDYAARAGQLRPDSLPDLLRRPRMTRPAADSPASWLACAPPLIPRAAWPLPMASLTHWHAALRG